MFAMYALYVLFLKIVCVALLALIFKHLLQGLQARRIMGVHLHKQNSKWLGDVKLGNKIDLFTVSW